MGQINIPIYQGGAEYATTRQAKESLSQAGDPDRFLAQPGPPGRRRRLGPQPGRGRRGARGPRGGLGQRSCADRRARRGQGRPADDARRAQRPAGSVAGANARWFRPSTTRSSIRTQLLSAIGRLNVPTLGLAVAEYDPRVHFDQVKSKWIGLRTPSGQVGAFGFRTPLAGGARERLSYGMSLPDSAGRRQRRASPASRKSHRSKALGWGRAV